MKRILCLLLSVAGVAGAKTNALPDKAAPRFEINSQGWDFSQGERQVVYYGQVRITDPQLRLDCERLTVNFPPTGKHPSHLQAETNVVMDFTDAKGAKYHATAAKAIYDYSVVSGVTNESGSFSGRPQIETPQGQMTGEPITWSRVNGQNLKLHAEHPTMGGDATNALPVKLF